MRLLVALLFLTFIGACTNSSRQGGDILVVGDSVMAWNRGEGSDIGSVIGAELGRNVVNRAGYGAQINITGLASFFGLSIPDQLSPGQWNWVVANGAANDLGLSCGCTRCDQEIDALISSDGKTGHIPAMIEKAQARGARVVWLGYYEAPETTSFEGCRPGLIEIERRVEELARSKDGVFFLDAEDVFDPPVREHFDPDMTHPSINGSALIGKAIAKVIARNA
jgi:hypothetical protein